MTQSPVPASTWQTPPEPAGPAPGVRFAGPGARLVAYLIDGFVAGLIIWLLVVVLGLVIAAFASAGAETATGVSVLVTILVLFAVAFLYFPYFWAKQNGQTPGMRMMRIRVVRDADGGPVGWGAALLRLVGYWVSSAVFYLGFIWILVDKRRRGWHDLIAGTCVIEA